MWLENIAQPLPEELSTTEAAAVFLTACRNAWLREPDGIAAAFLHLRANPNSTMSGTGPSPVQLCPFPRIVSHDDPRRPPLHVDRYPTFPRPQGFWGDDKPSDTTEILGWLLTAEQRLPELHEIAVDSEHPDRAAAAVAAVALGDWIHTTTPLLARSSSAWLADLRARAAAVPPPTSPLSSRRRPRLQPVNPRP